RVPERLQRAMRSIFSRVIETVCMAALEVTVAAVLDGLRKWLRKQDQVDALLLILAPLGEHVDLHLGEAAEKSAAAIMGGAIVYTLFNVAPAFIQRMPSAPLRQRFRPIHVERVGSAGSVMFLCACRLDRRLTPVGTTPD